MGGGGGGVGGGKGWERKTEPGRYRVIHSSQTYGMCAVPAIILQKK